MKIGAVIQARTSSTRLPEKVLKKLPCNSNITVLEQVIQRLKRSKLLDEIIIATTTDENDKKIIDIAEKEELLWYSGSKYDVLERYYRASRKNELDIVVRITSDCPCVDPDIVDLIIEQHLNGNFDYTSNTLIRSFPDGLDVEVFSFNALKTCYENAETSLEREHVTRYIYTHPNLFKIKNIEASDDLYAPGLRITLDTEEDYVLLCCIFDYLYFENKFFNAENIVKLFKDKPWLNVINNKITEKKSFETLEEEIREAIKILELQELNNAKNILEKLLGEKKW